MPLEQANVCCSAPMVWNRPKNTTKKTVKKILIYTPEYSTDLCSILKVHNFSKNTNFERAHPHSACV